MIKFSKILLISFLLISICSPSFAAKTLRNPQGRVSSGYKTEAYKPLTKTNITTKELEEIGSIIKQDEQQRKKKEKAAKEEKLAAIKRDKQVKEIAKKQSIEKLKEEKQKQKEAAIASKKAQETKIKATKAKKINQSKVAIKEQKNKVQEEKTVAMISKKPQEQNITEQLNSVQKTQASAQKTIALKNNNKDYETKKIINEISSELAAEKEQMLEELSTLWVSAVQKSDTVYFAIMKLSNPNGGEVNKNGFKKILEPIISAAPLVGQAFVNPALTAGSLIGSNVMGTMMNDSATRRLTRVNDADLVILARAIDELQEALLMNYMSYKNAHKEYELAIKIASDRKKTYDQLNKQNSPQLVLASTFYTESMDNQYKARQNFLMKRIVLEQMVGAEALHEIENKTSELSASNDL